MNNKTFFLRQETKKFYIFLLAMTSRCMHILLRICTRYECNMYVNRVVTLFFILDDNAGLSEKSNVRHSIFNIF